MIVLLYEVHDAFLVFARVDPRVYHAIRSLEEPAHHTARVPREQSIDIDFFLHPKASIFEIDRNEKIQFVVIPPLPPSE